MPVARQVTEAPAALRHTPLHASHLALGARMVPYAGFEMPVQYSSIIEEHRTVRGAVGLFDLSHMGELHLSGPEALAFARYAVVSDPGLLEPGQAQYSMLCAADGGIIDDLIVYRVEDGYLVVCNAANHDAVAAQLESLRAHGDFDVAVDDRSDETALIAPQGPAQPGAARPAHRPGPRHARQLPLAAGPRGGDRLPGGAHRLHRRGRLRALLRRPPRAPPVGCADGGGRRPRAATLRPRQPRHAAPRGRDAALRQRAGSIGQPVRGQPRAGGQDGEGRVRRPQRPRRRAADRSAAPAGGAGDARRGDRAARLPGSRGRGARSAWSPAARSRRPSASGSRWPTCPPPTPPSVARSRWSCATAHTPPSR